MRTKNLVFGSMLAFALLFGNAAFGQQSGMAVPAPRQNVGGKRHPHLAAAQRLCDQAFNKINEAQQANEWDLGGHARKAKELLDQASQELKQAAQASNENHK
jgi:hypothetical protein